MTIRKATAQDVSAVTAIYDELHTAEEAGLSTVGWVRGIYPTRETAEAALARGDLFVQEADGRIVGSAVINQVQMDSYAEANWRHPARDEEVMVLHTLTVSPTAARRGFGRAFVAFYEDYARASGCSFLRMDTQSKNTRARAMYRALGYQEVDTVPCVFNNIPGVLLTMLEKKL